MIMEFLVNKQKKKIIKEIKDLITDEIINQDLKIQALQKAGVEYLDFQIGVASGMRKVLNILEKYKGVDKNEKN